MTRRPSLRPGLAASLLTVILFVGGVGCSGMGVNGDGDAVKIAKTVEKNLNKGKKLLTQASEFDMLDPQVNLKGLPLLLEAEKLFFEARKLAVNSSKPRIALGSVRSLIGFVYHSHYRLYDSQIRIAERDGLPVPAGAVEKRAEFLRKTQEWIALSNREYEYYVRVLMQSYPQPLIYEQLSANYEVIGEYGAAEEMIHLFLKHTKLTRETQSHYEARARALRQKRLDEYEG